MKYFNDKNESATVKVRLFRKEPMMEWTVKLDGIPLTD